MNKAAQGWCIEARRLLDLRRPEGSSVQDATAAHSGGDQRPFDELAFAARWTSACEVWRKASDTVDGQIGALQDALLSSRDPELRQIGELGLNAVTGNHKVPLLAALSDVGHMTAQTRAPLVAAARQAINAMRDHLIRSEEVAVVDDNPLGVPVQIVATLLPALQALARSLDAASE